MAEPNTPTEGGDKQPETFKVFASKEEHDEYVNGIVKDRLDRERKKYADYDDLKMKAEKLTELEKSQMSEVERIKAELAEKDRLLQEATGELTGLKLQQMKASKLAEAGISAEWADSVAGNTEEEIAASVAKIAGRLKATHPKTGVGSNPANPQANLIASMTREELAEKCKDIEWYRKNQDAVMKALEKGEIK